MAKKRRPSRPSNSIMSSSNPSKPNHNPNPNPNPASPNTPDAPNAPDGTKNEDYIVDTIFPRREIHIVGGSSHSGKTTLLFHMINLWSRQEAVFGHQSYSLPFCYVSAVHSLDLARATARRVGVPADTPILSTVDVDQASNFEELIALARRRVDDLQVIFLDGIHTFCKGSIVEYEPVATFLRDSIRLLKSTGITVIASGRCTKNRESYRASNPCDRFMGSTAWSEFTSTFIAVDPRHPEDPRDRGRRILVMPKNAPGEMWDFEFGQNGTLVESASDTNSPVFVKFKLETFDTLVFVGHDPGEQISSKDMKEFAECSEISDRTLYRHLSNLIAQGKLTKSKWGFYQVASTQ